MVRPPLLEATTISSVVAMWNSAASGRWPAASCVFTRSSVCVLRADFRPRLHCSWPSPTGMCRLQSRPAPLQARSRCTMPPDAVAGVCKDKVMDRRLSRSRWPAYTRADSSLAASMRWSSVSPSWLSDMSLPALYRVELVTTWRGVGFELRTGQAQRVARDRLVEHVGHQGHVRLFAGVPAQFGVQVLVLGRAVGAPAVGGEVAQVHHIVQPAALPGGLQAEASQAVAAGVNAGLHFGPERAISREDLHHTAGRVAVELGKGGHAAL